MLSCLQVDPTPIFRESVHAKTSGDLASLDADACADVVTMFGRRRATRKSAVGGMRDLKVHAAALDLTKVRRRLQHSVSSLCATVLFTAMSLHERVRQFGNLSCKATWAAAVSASSGVE